MNSLHIHVCLGPCGGDAQGLACGVLNTKRLPSLAHMHGGEPIYYIHTYTPKLFCN